MSLQHPDLQEPESPLNIKENKDNSATPYYQINPPEDHQEGREEHTSTADHTVTITTVPAYGYDLEDNEYLQESSPDEGESGGSSTPPQERSVYSPSASHTNNYGRMNYADDSDVDEDDPHAAFWGNNLPDLDDPDVNETTTRASTQLSAAEQSELQRPEFSVGFQEDKINKKRCAPAAIKTGPLKAPQPLASPADSCVTEDDNSRQPSPTAVAAADDGGPQSEGPPKKAGAAFFAKIARSSKLREDNSVSGDGGTDLQNPHSKDKNSAGGVQQQATNFFRSVSNGVQQRLSSFSSSVLMGTRAESSRYKSSEKEKNGGGHTTQSTSVETERTADLAEVIEEKGTTTPTSRINTPTRELHPQTPAAVEDVGRGFFGSQVLNFNPKQDTITKDNSTRNLPSRRSPEQGGGGSRHQVDEVEEEASLSITLDTMCSRFQEFEQVLLPEEVEDFLLKQKRHEKYLACEELAEDCDIGMWFVHVILQPQLRNFSRILLETRFRQMLLANLQRQNTALANSRVVAVADMKKNSDSNNNAAQTPSTTSQEVVENKGTEQEDINAKQIVSEEQVDALVQTRREILAGLVLLESRNDMTTRSTVNLRTTFFENYGIIRNMASKNSCNISTSSTTHHGASSSSSPGASSTSGWNKAGSTCTNSNSHVVVGDRGDQHQHHQDNYGLNKMSEDEAVEFSISREDVLEDVLGVNKNDEEENASHIKGAVGAVVHKEEVELRSGKTPMVQKMNEDLHAKVDPNKKNEAVVTTEQISTGEVEDSALHVRTFFPEHFLWKLYEIAAYFLENSADALEILKNPHLEDNAPVELENFARAAEQYDTLDLIDEEEDIRPGLDLAGEMRERQKVKLRCAQNLDFLTENGEISATGSYFLHVGSAAVAVAVRALDCVYRPAGELLSGPVSPFNRGGLHLLQVAADDVSSSSGTEEGSSKNSVIVEDCATVDAARDLSHVPLGKEPIPGDGEEFYRSSQTVVVDSTTARRRKQKALKYKKELLMEHAPKLVSRALGIIALRGSGLPDDVRTGLFAILQEKIRNPVTDVDWQLVGEWRAEHYELAFYKKLLPNQGSQSEQLKSRSIASSSHSSGTSTARIGSSKSSKLLRQS